MKSIQQLAIVTWGYPTSERPNAGVFVKQLVDTIAEQGVRCLVIHPCKFPAWRQARKERASVAGSSGVRVYRPLWLSAGNQRFGPFTTYSLTHHAFHRSVWRVLRRLPEKPDALYGHFLYSAGETAVWAAGKLGIPGFVAVGEGTFWTVRPFGPARARRDFAGVSGVVAVSSLLRRKLVEELGFPSERIAVFPNGVDLRKFYPRDRLEMRRKYGLPRNQFLVIYVGNFIEPKGVRRVAEAIDGLPGVGGIFVGSGPLTPRITNLAFCGRVPHEQVPELLSAADCFVLPSDVEGSSNATLEAMACGLPVIVSDEAFNDDQVADGDNGIRVPWKDILALRRAVETYRDQPDLRVTHARRSLERARNADIHLRAANIMSFIRKRSGTDRG